MDASNDWQRSAANALCAARPSMPPGLCAWNGSDPAARWAVHRNTMRSSLIDALAELFPVLQRFVGRDFFRAMAAEFVADCPPRSPVLSAYGAPLAGWLAGFAPVHHLPCLPDLARLEWAGQRAVHAADAVALQATDLAPLLTQPEQVARLRLALHPSARVLVSRWAVVSLWHAHHGPPVEGVSQSIADTVLDARLALLALDQPEAALVLRWQNSFHVLSLSLADAALVRSLAGGQTLDRAAAAHPEADLTGTLALLLRHQAWTAAVGGDEASRP